MIDFALLAIVAVVAWCVSAEGAVAAAVTLISVLFSGLLAMNFFEPLAYFLENNLFKSWAGCDVLALIGLFVLFVVLFRLLGDRLMPTYIQVHGSMHQAGSWGCGVLTGYITMAFLLTALHTAPFPRDYWGHFYPERERRSGPLSAFGPDYQWLGFTQYVTERPFARVLRIREQNSQSPVLMTRMFDGRTEWFWNIPGEQSHKNVLSSFPIRYATRREKGGSGAASTSSGAPTATQPRPRRTGGGQRPGF